MTTTTVTTVNTKKVTTVTTTKVTTVTTTKVTTVTTTRDTTVTTNTTTSIQNAADLSMVVGVPGDLVVNHVVKDIIEELVTTQDPPEEESNVQELQYSLVTLRIALSMVGGVPGDLVVNPVVKDIIKELVTTQDPLEEEGNVQELQNSLVRLRIAIILAQVTIGIAPSSVNVHMDPRFRKCTHIIGTIRKTEYGHLHVQLCHMDSEK